MPTAPLRACSYIGCSVLSAGQAYCVTHLAAHSNARKLTRKRLDKERGSSADRGYGARWQRERKWYLKNNSLCVDCFGRGIVMASTVVDHIVPHKGSQELFWNRENWQALCATCHNRKTATKDSSFTNPGRFSFDTPRGGQKDR